MAKIEIGKLIYSITSKIGGKFKTDMKKTEKSVKRVGNQASIADKKSKGFFSTLKKSKGAVLGFVAGLTAIAYTIGKTIKAYNNQEVAEKRLETIAKQVTGANDEQIQSYKDLATEMQKVGVLGDEVIISGQSQLASFTKNADVVTELTDDLADLAVATYGTNVSQEQAIQTANNLGKALTGQLGALTRTGILVSDEYAEAMKNANTEMERASILSKIVQDNYGGLNKTLRETTEGRLQALKNKFGDLLEKIGGALLPALESLLDFFDRMNTDTEKGAKNLNNLAKFAYQATNSFLVLVKGVGLSVSMFFDFRKIILQTMNVARTFFRNLDQASAKIKKGKFGELKGIFSDTSDEIDSLKDTSKKSFSDMKDRVSSLKNSVDKALGGGFNELMDKSKKSTDILTGAMGGLGGGAGDAGDDVDGSKEKVEEWTDAITKAREEATKTAEKLSGELKKSFEDFTNGIGENLDETSKGLADIVIEAEKRRDEIKDAMREDGADKKALKEELSGVQEILDARENFEKEHANKLLEIRSKLEQAGIDPDSVGITGGDSSLEEDIAEKRRVAGLDEFTRFKEQQFAKLDILTSDFITEKTMYENKINHQKQLETGFTKFMQQEISTRNQAIQSFKMGDYASPSGVTSGANTGAGSSTTNNNVNVNANIGGTVKEMTGEELSAIMSFEMNKHI